MKKTILFHDASNIVAKNINQLLIEDLYKESNIILQKTHGQLFSIAQKANPKIVVLSASEYTQETHNFILDYASICDIYLIVDANIDNEELILLWNHMPVKAITTKTMSDKLPKSLAVFEQMYNDEIFYDKKINRNNTIAVMLSQDNSKNETVYDFTYPNQLNDKKIIALNNPNFESPINLGVFNGPDLSTILNNFSAVIDLDGKLCLESQACGIDYYDIDDITPKEAIETNKMKKLDLNLSDFTYKKFVQEQLLPKIRKNI